MYSYYNDFIFISSKIHNKIRHNNNIVIIMKIIVIGDIILDTNHYCNTIRNAPEANIHVYKIINTKNILGGAGNVAKNLQNLDCDIEIVSVIGNDYSGSLMKSILDENGIKNKLFIENGRKTTHKTRIFCDNVLCNRHDMEDTYNICSINEENIICYLKSLANVDAIIFSDYNKGVLTKNVCETLISYANSKNILTFVDPKPEGVIKYKHCFCLKLNLNEGETISGEKSKTNIMNYLNTHIQCKHIILTCGEHGLYVNTIDNHIFNKTPINVLDVTGCGDTVLVVVAFMYLTNKNMVNSCKVANHVARKCVEVIGNKEIFQSDLDSFIDCVIHDYEHHKISSLSSLSKNIVFTNGCFDIVHSAHIKLLQYSKNSGELLVLGLNTDYSVKKLKGNSRPINCEKVRCDFILSLGIVDYIILFNDNTPEKILSLLKPNKIIKGGDYKKEDIAGCKYADEVLIYDYISGFSSTNIIKKITEHVCM